jgi:hypothetical protein
MKKPNLSIDINSQKVITMLNYLFFLLVLADITVCFFRFKLKHPTLYGLVPEFYLANENNIPTYFSAFILLVSAALLKTVALFKKNENDKYSHHWSVMSLIFLYLSIDEAASIHEILTRPLRENFNLSGIFYYSWVIVGVAVILIFSIFYYKFWFSLPVSTKYRFLLAAAFYVSGIIVMESIGGDYVFINNIDLTEMDNLVYAMLTTIEESFEMIGVIIFINALLRYIESSITSVTLTFKSKSK